MKGLALAICLSMLAFVRVAHADDPGERASRRFYERGQKLFNQQKFDEALEQFQKAYDAKPIPDFLFNIGQCHRNLGDYESAIFSFKRFLKLDPDAANRELVERLIEDLQQKIDEGNTARLGLGKKKKPVPDAVETGDTPVYKKWWFWTAVAVVAVGAGVGIYVATSGDGTPDTTFGNIVFGK
ncbi:MAG: tetratricopeptide repeat protein [Kofleriaceae bacterium]